MAKPNKAKADAAPLHVLAVIGSLGQQSNTRTAVHALAKLLAGRGCQVDILDFRDEPLPLYNPDNARHGEDFPALQRRVDRADVFVLGTPDYHGSISSTMKSFLDHFWHEFAGKLFATLVASHEKGLTVTDQLRTVARQCYAWTLPYGLSFVAGEDVKADHKLSKEFTARLGMAAADISVYGRLLGAQRRADLRSSDPGFMARHRPAAAGKA
jgi:FMN reductase